MRLIDADVISYITAPIAPIIQGQQEHYETIAFKEDIDEVPTVDAVPVVHGYWIDTGKSDDAGNSFYMCSVCGCGDYHYPIVKVPYCWKCGARMDNDSD